jgi:signal peptidase I
MRPTLEPSQFVLINTVSYAFGTPQRGDIIFFHDPSDPRGRPLIRRIIGIPNDTITLTATQVQVNGVTLTEPYIYVPAGRAPSTAIVSDKKLGTSDYYVMCDSRVSDACTDSRTFDTVPRGNIIGKAVMVYWPITSIHLLPNYSDVFAHVGKH